jgi:hypothetical protein
MQRRHRSAARLAALVLAAAAAAHAGALEPPELAVLAGAFNAFNTGPPAEAGAEARWAPFRLPLGRRHLPVVPGLGVSANGDGGFHAYVTFRADLRESWAALGGGDDGGGGGDRWRVVPFTGVGWYEAGDGKDLGGPVEFRSGLEVSRRVGGRSWIGLSFHHLSNSGIYSPNPGAESLLLVWSWR